MLLRQFQILLRKRWIIILLCVLIAGGGASLGSRFAKHFYQSTVVMQIDIRPGRTSSRIVQMEVQLATSNSVIQGTAARYRGLSAQELMAEVTVTTMAAATPNKKLFQINVLDPNQARAISLASDIATALLEQFQQTYQQNVEAQRQTSQDIVSTQQQIDTITNQIAALRAKNGQSAEIDNLRAQSRALQIHLMQQQSELTQLELAQARNADSLRIAQSAQLASTLERPNMFFSIGSGSLAGFFLGLLLALLFERLDIQVSTIEDLKQLLNYSARATSRLSGVVKEERPDKDSVDPLLPSTLSHPLEQSTQSRQFEEVSGKESEEYMRDSASDETQPLAAVDKPKRSARRAFHFRERQPRASTKKKKLTRKALIIRIGILCALLFLVGSGAILGVMQYQQYRKDLAQAQAAVQHLRKAEALLSKLSKNPFDVESTGQAQQEFSSALSLFQRVGTDLNALPGMSASIPIVGSKVVAAQQLLPLAIEVSQMGVTTCKTLNLLAPALRNPMGTIGPKLTQADLTTAGQNLQQIQTTLNLLVTQINHLQPSDLQLDPSLGKFVGTFRKDGPILQDELNQAQTFLTVAPVLLGVNTPANYLLEILDSTELRPGGGFIGNYGTLTLANGRVANISMTDVDLIDKPFEQAGHSIPYPPAYRWFDLAPQSWSFRDSNLDADFPTSARNGEQTYTLEGGKGPLQGVIAITPWFMQGLLNITGPINMRPEYNETVTAQNLIDRIHFHQLGNAGEGSELIPSPDGHSSLRKRFTSYLAEHIIARVHQLVTSPAAFSSLFKLLMNSLQAKDIQIYLNSSSAENLLQHYQFASSIQASPGDSLFVVDANIAANKANDFIKYTMYDQVTIDTSGNAVHHTTLSYAWVLHGQNYGSSLYQDYVRIYVPPGSILQTQHGWESRGQSQAFGRKVWAGFFTLTFGQTQVITLTWTSPGAAKLGAQGWHYQDLIQKQAGDTWAFNLQITLPSCAVNTQASGLVMKGKQTATISRFLSEDIAPSLSYRCS